MGNTIFARNSIRINFGGGILSSHLFCVDKTVSHPFQKFDWYRTLLEMMYPHRNREMMEKVVSAHTLMKFARYHNISLPGKGIEAISSASKLLEKLFVALWDGFYCLSGKGKPRSNPGLVIFGIIWIIIGFAGLGEAQNQAEAVLALPALFFFIIPGFWAIFSGSPKDVLYSARRQLGAFAQFWVFLKYGLGADPEDLNDFRKFIIEKIDKHFRVNDPSRQKMIDEFKYAIFEFRDYSDVESWLRYPYQLPSYIREKLEISERT